jgi:hypothetical protein
MRNPIEWLQQMASGYSGKTGSTFETNNPGMDAISSAISGYDVFGDPVSAGLSGLASYFANR